MITYPLINVFDRVSLKKKHTIFLDLKSSTSFTNEGSETIENKDRVVSSYNAGQITVLEGLEPVRRRPGVFIGSTGIKGLHHLVGEIIDNSIDESLAGYCDNVYLSINSNLSISISDFGRGIPTDIHPITGKTALETVMTILHAGGKFGSGGYKVSGGLHGVGISVLMV